jgi:hypothetical protein
MTTKKCSFCAEEIQEEAVKCRFFGSWVNPRSGGASGLSKRLTRSADERMLAGTCGGIA